MQARPVRILHVFDYLGLGGAETRTVELYRCIDREKVQFDFLVHTNKEEYYDRAVEELGARIYRIPRFHGGNLFEYRRALEKLFSENAGTWEMVHGHLTSRASLYFPVAKKHGVRRVIAHARSAGTDPGIKTLATKLFEFPLRIPGFADNCFAVSAEAGESVFGRYLMKTGRVQVITNAIDTSRAAFNADLRERLRAELNLRGCLVVGHVGSFVYAKNHPYLLQVFAEMVRNNTAGNRKLKLMLAGAGPAMESMRVLAHRLGIENDVLFLGKRNDMKACYSAMDVFVYPSHYEGLPGVVVEAQAAGLPCLISANITKEVMVTPLVTAMDIGLEAGEWAKKADSMLRNQTDRQQAGTQALETLRRAGFDVREQARRMTAFYLGEKKAP